MNPYNWPLINDNITAQDREVLSQFCLHGERFTNGPKVAEFEKLWSRWLGVKYSAMVNSGASANFISIAIVKYLKGLGEVIVPTIGWVSDISSIIQLGMTPILVDVKMGNLGASENEIETLITPKTKAIVLVHALGFNALNNKIIELAKKHDIMLIEDCCEAHGATFGDKKVGSIGDISVFSFYFGHHITTIEGGMICVNELGLYDLAKMFRSHGMTRESSPHIQDLYKKSNPNLNPLFTFAVPGFNMRSTELNAVLGIEQMNRLDYNIERRRQNLDIWLKNLDSKLYFTSFEVEGNSSFALPLILNPETEKNVSHNDLMFEIIRVLETEKVEYRIGTAGGGNQALQPYIEEHIPENVVYPNADYIHYFSLYIGNHPELNEEQIINLCKKLNNV